MSRPRQVSEKVRTVIKSLIATEQTLGQGVYATTAMINNFSIQGGNHLTQSILGALPGFSILHGVLNTVEGIAIMTGAADHSLARIRHWRVTEREKYIRGGVQAISGLFLAEGGVEALLGVDTLGLSLLWRLAVNSMIEFVSAMYDLNKLYIFSKNWGELDSGIIPSIPHYIEAKFDVISSVLAKGLACAGWTALAMAPLLDSMTVPLGLACLALSAIGTLYRDRGKIALFFSPVTNAMGCTTEDRFPPRSTTTVTL
jgi:hypothetical protein